MAKNHSDSRDTAETVRNGVLRQGGYNAGIDMPVDIEPVPKDAADAALDVRNMPDNGAVEIHDDDEDILDREKTTPISK